MAVVTLVTTPEAPATMVFPQLVTLMDSIMAMMVPRTEVTCKEMATTVSVKEDMRRIMVVRPHPGHSGLTVIPQKMTTTLAHLPTRAFTFKLTPPHAIDML